MSSIVFVNPLRSSTGTVATFTDPELFEIAGAVEFMPTNTGSMHPTEAVVLIAMTGNNFAEEGTAHGKRLRD